MLEQELLNQSLGRINEIEALGYRAHGKRYDFSHTVPEILETYSPKTAEKLEPLCVHIQSLRRKGKAVFLHLSQNGAKLQVYIEVDVLPELDDRTL